VTRENFVRAETDRMFRDIAALAGGVNRLGVAPELINQAARLRGNGVTLSGTTTSVL